MTAGLSRKENIEIMSNGIISAHHGQAVFNISETAVIINKDRKFVGPEFDERGILAIRQGNSKYYTSVAIAEYLYSMQISPIQTCRKGA